jgi:hypothetical protein
MNIIWQQRKLEETSVTPAHLSYYSDKPPASKEQMDIADYSKRRKQLIIGYDANADILRSGTDINRREENFIEYLVSFKLSILHQGNECTFEINDRRDVIDLSLGTDRIGNWHVSDGPSSSDHRSVVPNR